MKKEVFIPLSFALGQQFQFDWGEADVKINGQVTRIYLFCMELSASRKMFVWAYRNEQQESFLDGFVRGFDYFGGVHAIGLFDNLKSAVKKILTGRTREEQESFIALQAHYVFEAEFSNPNRGNEKGIVGATCQLCAAECLGSRSGSGELGGGRHADSDPLV